MSQRDLTRRTTPWTVLLMAGFSLLLSPPGPSPTASTSISFEERVEAQRAIEAVYFSHLEGSRRTFQQAVTPELLERKVRTYLKESAALDAFWNTPITAESLQREAARIARDTKYPERLREIQAALNHDPVLYQETFVRASLADRLARSFFAFDKPTHEAARVEAEEIRARLVDGTIDPLAEHSRRIVEPIGDESPLPVDSSTDERFRSSRNATMQPLQGFETLGQIPKEEIRPTPTVTDTIGTVEEHAGDFSIRVTGASSSSSVIYRVPKTTWDNWWAARQTTLSESDVAVVAQASGIDVSARALEECPPDDTWDNGALDDRPDGRYEHDAIWTGTEMIVWGGRSVPSPDYVGNAGRYDPLTDTWRGVSLAGSPVQFLGSTAVWTGTEILVWGYRFTGYPAGGRYDPISDTWRPLSTVDEPTPRLWHSAIWTGTEMIIWGGGFITSTGARYNPQTDSWRPTSLVGAPTPRQHHSAVWTGTEMIIWGGEEESDSFSLAQSGARYDPATDSWSPTILANAPSGRKEHTAIWTGTEMLIWGGLVGGFSGTTATGGRYNPASDSWSGITSDAAPAARRAHTAVWTGSRMLVWGGSRHTNPNRSGVGGLIPVSGGGSYDPVLDRWQPLSTTNAPPSVAYHAAVWTGSLMVVWGGTRGGGLPTGSALGGRYDPSTDSWTPTTTALGGVAVNGSGRIVWTGTEMLVWGGGGGRYDLLTDSWKGISTTNAPSDQRALHAAVWTGDEMMIVGGFRFSGPALTPGRYNPTTDSWQAVSTVDSPDVREGATAVWTGREVIVWGGIVPFFPPNAPNTPPGTGGRYDPSTDTWRLLPDRDEPKYDSNAPASVRGHTAVWTGTEMIVFGGLPNGAGATSYGARYNPENDLWTPLPGGSEMTHHTAVWTGTQMLVQGVAPRVYDLATNTWSFTQAPLTFSRHAAVWTGRHMLVWGGAPGYVTYAYDHQSGTSRELSIAGAPMPRDLPDAIWTGKFMIVWGGSNSGLNLTSGGRYIFGQNSDDDGDLVSECEGDCNDADAGVWPGAPERCNGGDDSCEGTIDEDADGLDSDSDGNPNSCDACPQFPNPGQADPLACMAARQDGGECLETGIVLASQLQDGFVSVLREVETSPDVIHLDFMVVSCTTATSIEVLLNEQSLTTFVDPDPDSECGCSTPFHRVTISDRERIRELWNSTGANLLRVRKAEFDRSSFSGTVLGWVRAQVGSGTQQDSETTCLFDARGANCSRPICTSEPGWFTFDAVDVSRSVELQPTIEETLVSAPFAGSVLPGTIDINHVPDGPLRLCVGSTQPPLLLAADDNAGLRVVDVVTGGTAPYGSLESETDELAHDDISRRTISQTVLAGASSLQQVHFVGLKSLEVSPYIGGPLSGMEFLDGKLYGVEAAATGARVMRINPVTGSFQTIATLLPGAWDGLVYDDRTGLFYAAQHREDTRVLWSIEAGSGWVSRLNDLAFPLTGLEVGPDGTLYATRTVDGDTELYRLDASTGIATLVGPMGVSNVVSLVTVRNQPRACIEIVKQGEQTLAINGGCNAPPSASAGADLAAECASTGGSRVMLNGSASSDPDSTAGTNDDIVLFEWFEGWGTSGQTILGVGQDLDVLLPVGEHHITLVVTDAGGETAIDEIAVGVVDTMPPVVTAAITRYIPPQDDLVGIGNPQGWDHHGDDDDDDGGGHGEHGDDDDDGHHGDDDDDDGHGGNSGKRYVLELGSADVCDASASMSATLSAAGCSGTLAVSDGQVIRFKPKNGQCRIETKKGVLTVQARGLTVRVTGVDESGNQAVSVATLGKTHGHQKPALLEAPTQIYGSAILPGIKPEKRPATRTP